MTNDVEKVYREFWQEIVAPNGKLDLEQVKKELFDFHKILEEVPKVYDNVTGGRLSKPNTPASVIVGEFEALYCPIDFCNEIEAENTALRAELEEAQRTFDNVTRLEVVGNTRELVKWDISVKASFQDNGRTLKLFISDTPRQNG